MVSAEPVADNDPLPPRDSPLPMPEKVAVRVDTSKDISSSSSITDDKVDSPGESTDNDDDYDGNAEEGYPGMVGLRLAIFLVSLDFTTVATVVSAITDEFNSLDQVGWYGSAFFLTVASFQSIWGKGQQVLYENPKHRSQLSRFVIPLFPVDVEIVPHYTGT